MAVMSASNFKRCLLIAFCPAHDTKAKDIQHTIIEDKENWHIFAVWTSEFNPYLLSNSWIKAITLGS